MLTLAVIGGIILLLSAVHSCNNGGRIAKAAQSSNPEVRKDAERTIKIICFIGVLCVVYFIWPILVTLAVLYIIFKLFSKL